MQSEKTDRFCSCVGLTKKQIEFLDKMSKCCRYSGGRKLSKAAIIRALISVAKELDINVEMVKSEEHLKDRLVGAFCDRK